MRTGKIQIQNCRLPLAVRPPPRSFQPSVAAVIDVKTDLPTQDLATLAFRCRSPNEDYSVVDVAVGARVLRCPATLPSSAVPAAGVLARNPETGDTLWPFRDFYIWNKTHLAH